MIDPKQFEIDGLRFYTQPLPALRAMLLDKKVLALLLPALKGLKDLKVDAEADIDLGAITEALSESLSSMKDAEMTRLVIDLLSSTTYQGDKAGEANNEITEAIINQIFQGQLLTLYKVMLEVMKYNKFSPFAFLGDGAEILKTLTSSSPKKKGSRRGSSLETSGSLLDQ